MFCTDSPRSHLAESGEGTSAPIEQDDGIVQPSSTISTKKNNGIDLFCYKKYIYVFPHENLSEQACVDKDKYTSST